MMMPIVRLCAAALLLVTGLAAASEPLAPQRTVTGNTVVSPRDPAASIEIVPPATYIGAERFVLFGAADCEIHLFVDADADKRIRRLYWVQFEAYLPEHPELSYAPSRHYSPTTLSGLPFHQRARFGTAADVPKAGSDAERGYAMLKAAGYTLPAETINATFIHYPDAAKRTEVLVIVLEDMAPTGVTFAKLTEGGTISPSWAPVAEQLLDRASKAFAVVAAHE